MFFSYIVINQIWVFVAGLHLHDHKTKSSFKYTYMIEKGLKGKRITSYIFSK